MQRETTVLIIRLAGIQSEGIPTGIVFEHLLFSARSALSSKIHEQTYYSNHSYRTTGPIRGRYAATSLCSQPVARLDSSHSHPGRLSLKLNSCRTHPVPDSTHLRF